MPCKWSTAFFSLGLFGSLETPITGLLRSYTLVWNRLQSDVPKLITLDKVALVFITDMEAIWLKGI